MLHKYIICLLLILTPLFLFGQINNTDKGAATIYTKGLPTGAVRLKYDSEWAIDINTSKIYRYDRNNSVWLLAGSTIGFQNNSNPPSGAPKYGAPEFVLNNTGALYAYYSSAWHCLNCAAIGYVEGTGIDITGNVITNTLPDQTVTLGNGTGISVTGTYPNFTITNTAPDQTVTLTGAGITSISGTYPNFTITSTEVDGSTTNEIQQIDTFTLSGDTLKLSLSSDGVPHKQVILTGLSSLSGGIYGPSDTVTYHHTAVIDSGLTFRSYEDTSYFNILTGLNYGSFLTLKPDSTLIRWFDVGGNNQILFNSDGINLSTTNPDRVTITGNDVRYTADYRATYNDRSITDKKYQDDFYLQEVDTFRLSNDTLFISLIRDSVPESFVVLSGLGGSTDTSGYNLDFRISNDTLYIEDGDGELFVDLAPYLDNTDTSGYNSDLYVSGDTLYIVDGNGELSVDLSVLDTIIVKTVAEMQTLKSNSEFLPGKFYLITDAGQVGERGLLMQAVSNNQLSIDGVRFMLCPTYYGVNDISDGNEWNGVWNPTKSFSIGDLTIWGGFVWRNLTGDTGTYEDSGGDYLDGDIILDSDNWEKIEKDTFNNGEYTELIFGVSYSLDSNWIQRQWDGKGNIFGITKYANTTYWAYGFNPVDVSDWNMDGTQTPDVQDPNLQMWNNICLGVWNNSNNGKILGNIVTSGGIIFNYNDGEIGDNNVPYEIRENSNNGTIQHNVGVSSILNNSNNGPIEYNIMPGSIASNSNDGPIAGNKLNGNGNTEQGSINSNGSNVTDIIGNSNNGDITSNNNVGPISFNTNNGGINNCTGTADITRNTINASITGAQSGTVTEGGGEGYTFYTLGIEGTTGTLGQVLTAQGDDRAIWENQVDTSGYNLSFNRSNDTLYITDGNGVLFVVLPDSTGNQVLSIDSTDIGGVIERFEITLSNGNTIYLDVPQVSGFDIGQNNIGMNLGNGEEIYAGKADTTLQFKTLVELYGINLISTDTTIRVEADTTQISTLHDVAVVQGDIDAHEIADEDLDNTNELQTLIVDSVNVTGKERFLLEISDGNIVSFDVDLNTDTSGYNTNFTIVDNILTIGDGQGELFVDLDSFNINLYNSNGIVPATVYRDVNLDTASYLNFIYPNGVYAISITAGADSTAASGNVFINSSDDGSYFQTDNSGFELNTTRKFYLTFGDDEDNGDYTEVKNQSSTANLYMGSATIALVSNSIDELISASVDLDTLGTALLASGINGNNFGAIGFYQSQGTGVYLTLDSNLPNPGQILVAQADQTFHYADLDTILASAQVIDTFEIVNDSLYISLSNDDLPVSGVDLSPYLDNTDAQTLSIDSTDLVGIERYAISISNGNTIYLDDDDRQTLSIDSTTVGTSERFTLSVSEGNNISFDIPQGTVTGSGTAPQIALWNSTNGLTGSSTLTYQTNTMSFLPSTKDTILYVLGEGGNYFGLSTHVDTFNAAATAYKIGALNRNGRVYITSYETYLQGALRQVEGSGIETRGTSGSMFWHLNGNQYSGTTTGDNATHNRNLHWYFTSGGVNYGNPVVFQHNYSNNDSTGNTFEFLARNTASGGITIPDSTLFRVGNWDHGTALEIKHSLDVGFQTKTPTRDVDINGEVRIRDLTTTTPTLIVGADATGVLSNIKLGTNLSFSNDTLNATGSGGLNGIYGDGSPGSGDNYLPFGGTIVDVGLNNALIFDLDSNATLDNRVIYMQVETDNDESYTRWLSMVAPTDSLRITSYDQGMYLEFEGVTGAGEGLVIRSNTKLTLDADSTKLLGAPIRNEAHYLTGWYNNTLTKVEGTTTGQTLVWDDTDGIWELGTPSGTSYYQTMRDDGTDKTQRGKLNFTSGSIISATLSDDGANDETEVLMGIISGSISNTEIGTNAVNSDELADNGVADVDIRQSTGLSVIGRSANSTGNVADITAGTDNNVLRRSGTSIGWGAINLASGDAVTGLLPVANLAAGAFVDGGNTLGATATLGTNDAQSLVFETNNTAFMTTNSSGNVGLGTTPGSMRLAIALTDVSTSGTPIGLQTRVVESPGSNSSASYRSLNMANQFDAAGINFTGNPQAGWFENRVINAGDFTSNLYGIYVSGLLMGSDAATIGTVTNTAAIHAIPVTSFSNSIAGTVTKAIGVLVQNSAKGSLTMTNQIGVNVSALSAGTNNTAILIGTNTAPTGNYGIYSTVTDSSIMSGPFKAYSLVTTATLAATNTVTDRLLIQTNTSGAVAAGQGGGILFQGETSTNENQDIARISTSWTNVTHASRTSAFKIQLVASAAALADVLKIERSGSNWEMYLNGGTTSYSNAYINPFTPFTFGGTSSALTLGGSSGSVTISNTSTNNIAIHNTANAATSTAGIVIGNATSFTQTSGTRNYMEFNYSFAPTSGTAVHNSLVFSGTDNQTGGANGIVRRIYDNTTLTAVADYRSIEIAVNETDAKGIYQIGSSTTNNFVGSTMFGSTSAPASVAAIEISSTTKGLLLPRMTTTQRDAITAVEGLVIYNTTTTKMECYDGATWQAAW